MSVRAQQVCIYFTSVLSMQVPLRNCEEYFVHDSPVLSFSRLAPEKYVSLTKTAMYLWYRSQTDAR